MILKDKIILITGASGGIGSALVAELIEHNVKKIYAADISMDALLKLKQKHGEIIFPIVLDITSETQIIDSKDKFIDVDILINNAGIKKNNDLLDKNSIGMSRSEMAVNFIGMYTLSYFMVDLLLERKSSAIVNILSIASFSLINDCATYCASKAAANVITHAMREKLKETSVNVFAVYPGYVNTNMVKNSDIEKVTPESVAKAICCSIEDNVLDIFPDPMSLELSKKENYRPDKFLQ